MSEADFKSLLNIDARTRKAIEVEQTEAEWAAFGRTVHENLVNVRFITALQTAMLAGGKGGTKAIARRITAFLLTGTITS